MKVFFARMLLSLAARLPGPDHTHHWYPQTEFPRWHSSSPRPLPVRCGHCGLEGRVQAVKAG